MAVGETDNMATAVIFSSKTGNTKAVATYIASKIGAELIDVKKGADLSKYDKIILGCGVYAGKPSKIMTKFVEENREKLASASLFVTCMYNDDKGAEQLERIATSFGIADAIFFDKAKKQIGAEDSKLEEYIKTL